MKRKILLVAAMALLSGAFSLPALANERVQLKAFTALGVSKQKAKPKALTVTVFFEVRDSADAKRLCKISPRYQEAIFYRLSNKLYPLTGKLQLDVDAVRDDLEPVIRKIDRSGLILKIDVVRGVPEFNKNVAIMFSRTGCIKVR